MPINLDYKSKKLVEKWTSDITKMKLQEEKLDKKIEKMEKQLEEEMRIKLEPFKKKSRELYQGQNTLQKSIDGLIESHCDHSKTHTRKRGDQYTEHWVRICSDCNRFMGEI